MSLVEVTCVSVQGMAGDLYPLSNIDDVDAHLVTLEERDLPKEVYEHDRDLLLDVRRVLERAGSR